MPDTDIALLVFTRTPVPGRCKRRLAPALGPVGAARLHARLLARTLARVRASALLPVQLWVDGALEHPCFQPWRHLPGWTLHRQPPGDLGERMHAALAAALRACPGALLLGSDVDSLHAAALRRAAAALAAGHDAVLAPTVDGGYGLIGLRHPAPGLFTAMPWGGPGVAGHTRARLRRLGWRWLELPRQWDVDRPEDLNRLPPSLLRGL